MHGGTITISIAEAENGQDEVDSLMKAISECETTPSERVLTLGLRTKWEIGEAGIGGGWKAGDDMDVTDLRLDSSALSIEDVLLPATRTHAAHLLQFHAAPLIANSNRLISPVLESKKSRPIALYVPVPARRRNMDLSVSVSHHSGRIEIEDEGAKLSAGSGGDERANRTRQATFGVHAGATQLGEALRRLVMAVSLSARVCVE
jgi:mediator of RNA polymerase II transcription subunit 14